MNPATDWIPASIQMPTTNDLTRYGNWLYLLMFKVGWQGGGLPGYDANGFGSLQQCHEWMKEHHITHWARIKPPPSEDSEHG